MKILTGIVLVLIVLIAGYYLLVAPPSTSNSEDNATTTPPTVSVETKYIHEETPTLVIEAQYPQLGIAAVDTQVETIVLDSIDAFKKDTQNAPPSPADAKYEFASVYDPPNIGDDIISVRLIISTYTGGAHPLAYVSGLNFDRTSGKMLALSDALRLIDLSLSAVADESLRQMRARNGESLFADGLVATPENYGTFVVDGTKVTFIFQLYQVAAYSAGFQEVSFPRKQ